MATGRTNEQIPGATNLSRATESKVYSNTQIFYTLLVVIICPSYSFRYYISEISEEINHIYKVAFFFSVVLHKCIVVR